MTLNKRPGFQVGDIVTRDGTDRHRVTATNGCDKYAPDFIDVVCIKEPEPWIDDDGNVSEPWTRLGETETNMANHYYYPDDVIGAVQIVEALPPGWVRLKLVDQDKAHISQAQMQIMTRRILGSLKP